MSKMHFDTIGPLNYAAMYSISFGCFKTLFRYIDIQYKQSFIDKYTSHLNNHSFNVLYSYFDCIRIIRNRCAHGNHIITLKLKNDLNCHRKLVTNKLISPLPNEYVSVFEAVLLFIIKQSNCGKEFKQKLAELFKKYNYASLLTKYVGKHSLSAKTPEILFDSQ